MRLRVQMADDQSGQGASKSRLQARTHPAVRPRDGQGPAAMRSRMPVRCSRPQATSVARGRRTSLLPRRLRSDRTPQRSVLRGKPRNGRSFEAGREGKRVARRAPPYRPQVLDTLPGLGQVGSGQAVDAATYHFGGRPSPTRTVHRRHAAGAFGRRGSPRGLRVPRASADASGLTQGSAEVFGPSG
jgi:hypothetical protein